MSETPAPHEPSGNCGDMHCYVHHVDEPANKAYVVCFECNHVYANARALRQASRRQVRSFPRPHRWLSDEWDMGYIRFWIKLLTVRARRIYFCQECLHDF